jgi:hypothetical protein
MENMLGNILGTWWELIVHYPYHIIYINLVSFCFCDGGFGGWGKGEAGEAMGEKLG